MQSKYGAFKTCPKCLRVWETEADFLCLREIEILGFMANPLHPEKGALMFNHRVENCGTTLSIPIQEMKQLIGGYEDGENAWLSPDCDGHCLIDDSLKPCDHPNCWNAIVGDVFQKLLTNRIEKSA